MSIIEIGRQDAVAEAPALAQSHSVAIERFAAIDAWRGVAALMVALFRLHIDGWFHGLELVRNAHLFVDFFFVLSGFVIAHAYFDRLGSPRQTAVFLVRRFGRLWPLHVTLLLLIVGLEAARGVLGGSGAATQAFTDARAPVTIAFDALLIQALGITGPTGWNTPAWSISTEFWTYVLFAILCLGGRRLVLGLAPVIVVGALAVIALRAPQGMASTFDYGLFRCIAGFFTGLLLNQAWVHSPGLQHLIRRHARVAEVAVVVIAAAFVSYAAPTPLALLAPLIFGGVVIVFACEAGPMAAAFGGRLGRLLGDLSYSIYMTALLISLAFNKAGALVAAKLTGLTPAVGMPPGFGLPLLGDLFALAYLATVVVVSWITYRLIEMPARAWFNRLSTRI